MALKIAEEASRGLVTSLLVEAIDDSLDQVLRDGEGHLGHSLWRRPPLPQRFPRAAGGTWPALGGERETRG